MGEGGSQIKKINKITAREQHEVSSQCCKSGPNTSKQTQAVRHADITADGKRDTSGGAGGSTLVLNSLTEEKRKP